MWPCKLDHFQLDTLQPKALSEFYRDAMGMVSVRLNSKLWLLEGRERRLLLGKGQNNEQPFTAMALGSSRQVSQLRAALADRRLRIAESPTPLFRPGAFAVCDDDGRQMVFGVPIAHRRATPPRAAKASKLSARLQHLVVATPSLDKLSAFYEKKLGFLISDTVYKGAAAAENDQPIATFFRAGEEHHSFAAFLAPAARHDHHSYETTCWDDIRDWLDHFADLGVTPWWGPGRHGPGNNAFFMVKDTDGNNIELSAELQTFAKPVAGGRWPMVPSTLNRWGAGWNRLAEG